MSLLFVFVGILLATVSLVTALAVQRRYQTEVDDLKAGRLFPGFWISHLVKTRHGALAFDAVNKQIAILQAGYTSRLNDGSTRHARHTVVLKDNDIVAFEPSSWTNGEVDGLWVRLNKPIPRNNDELLLQVEAYPSLGPFMRRVASTLGRAWNPAPPYQQDERPAAKKPAPGVVEEEDFSLGD
jgi:hypothetical protein